MSTPTRNDWSRRTVPPPQGPDASGTAGTGTPRERTRKRTQFTGVQYLTPDYYVWMPQQDAVTRTSRMSGSGSGPGRPGSPAGSLPDSELSGHSLPKLRGGAPDLDHSVSVDSGRPMTLSPKPRHSAGGLSGPSSPASPATLPKSKRTASSPSLYEDEMDMKLAMKLGIFEEATAPSSPEPPGHGHSFSFSSASTVNPTAIRTILKHSDAGLEGVSDSGASHHAASSSCPGPGSPVGAGATPSSPAGSATSPIGSAHSLPSEVHARRRVSIAVQEDKTPSAHSHLSHLSHLSRGPSELSKHVEENGKTPSIQDHEIYAKKRSLVEILYNKVYPEENIESSSWYLFCKRVRKKDAEANADAWEPPHWQVVCPYPFCPTYRQFARLTGLTLVVLLLWGSAYAVLGDSLAPGGQLFGLAVLTIAAHFGGWLVALTTLPALVGMLLVGILFQNVGLFEISGDYLEVVSVLRKIALVIILTRAGLDLDPPALKQLLCSVLKLGLVPWFIECISVAVLTNLLLGVPWVWGFLLGSSVAAVSPAVTVPCLIRLRGKGYGVAKGIPTLIIAVSGIDDAASVAGFGIIQSILFSHDSLLFQILQGPLSLLMGLGFGIAWGILAKYVPEKNDPFVVPLRVLMLFGGGLIAVLGSESIGLGGAGPLAVVAAAFVSCYSWTQQGWEVEENPVATAFEIFWMVFEPILFGLTGTQIKIDNLDTHMLSLVVGGLVVGFAIRIAFTMALAFRSRFNTKERVFVALSLMAKATVQAALAAVPLDSVRDSADKAEKYNAEVFLNTNVMSILLTAPTVAILMTLLGPRLLTKTTLDPEFPENWRRHTRPSLRDISIIDERDEDDDADEEEREGKLSRRSSRRSSAKDNKDKHDKDREISLTTIP